MAMARILAVTWDGGGNVPPLLGVATRLRERGHHVRVLGHAQQRAAVESSGAEFVAYRHARPWSADPPRTSGGRAASSPAAGPAARSASWLVYAGCVRHRCGTPATGYSSPPTATLSRPHATRYRPTSATSAPCNRARSRTTGTGPRSYWSASARSSTRNRAPSLAGSPPRHPPGSQDDRPGRPDGGRLLPTSAEPATIRATVRALLFEGSHQRAAATIGARLRANDGAANAVEEIEALLQSRSTPSASPATSMDSG